MTDESDKIATLEERSKNDSRRIGKLEDNQKWGVITILGLGIKAAFDFFTTGG